MAITIEPLSDANFDLWLEFFDARALKDNPDWDGCYCQAYLNSSEDEAEIEKSGMAYQDAFRKKACERQAARIMQGYVAIDNGKVIGWMASGPGKHYVKFPEVAEKTARVICFTIDPLRRGEGLATSLLKYGLEDLKSRGFSKVESKGVPEGLAASTNYPGPISMYEKFGFKTVETFDDGYALMELIF